VGLALGVIALPAVIFAIGNGFIGTYAGGTHGLGAFYGNFFGDLAKGSTIAWALAVVPYLLLLILYLIFRPRTPARAIDDESATPRERARKEPRVS
jgi:hypothetical protein